MKPEESPEARRRAIELLEANHGFPCSFSLSVIARTDDAVEAAFAFAQCMRDNGTEEFADPQLRADGDFFLAAPVDVNDEELAAARG